MDKKEYHEKITTLLNDNKTCQLLPRDPAKACEQKMKSMLTRLKGKLKVDIYRKINTTDGITPRLYGVPKIHKPNNPLRPIVSFIGSPTYELSKYLSKVLSPLVGNNEYHLRKSQEWTSLANTLIVDKDEELVSFDVVSLFTSIPTNVAVDVAKVRLSSDTSLPNRTPLTPSEIASLMEFCLKSTELQYDGKYYRQIHGTAMGSPVSVVVANLVMEELERKALTSFAYPPRVFKRYIDDTVCILKRSHIQPFHQHLNDQDPNIKFTIERYTPAGLPFLDTLNTVLEDGSIDISIYRKKTHTDHYLSFDSHHPPQHKASVVRTLNHRANTLLTNEEHQCVERRHIHKALSDNGYPKSFLKKHDRKIKSRNKDDKDDEWKGFVTLPYVGGTTEKIQRILTSHKIKTAIKPSSTLRQVLSKPKDAVPNEKKTGVVYEIPCADCDLVYIGETGRSLLTRTKEHIASVRLAKVDNSALAEHCHKTDHAVAWKDTKILATESRWHQRKWTEACLITKNTNAIFNRDSGRILPASYVPIISQ